jgi:hypothetical protein
MNRQDLGLIELPLAGLRSRGRRVWLLVSTFLLLSACTESAMAKYVLFSPVSGKIVVAGKPLAGATVKRWYKGGYSSKEDTEITRTDGSGQFAFPMATFSSLMAGIMPHEPVVTQRMFVQVDGQEVQIYGTVKHNYELNGEFVGQPLNFVFDPTAEIRQVGSELTPISIRSPKP